jgi:hypothetical protein
LSSVTVAVPLPPEAGFAAAFVVETVGGVVSVPVAAAGAEDVVDALVSAAISPESDDEDEHALTTSTKPINADVSRLPTISPLPYTVVLNG